MGAGASIKETRIYIRKYSERLAVEVYKDGELDYDESDLNCFIETVPLIINHLKSKFGKDVYIRDERGNTSGN